MELRISIMDIHEKLRRLTSKQRIKAAELGEIAEAGRTTAYDWLNGKSSPSLAQSLRIARKLGVSLDWLADDGASYPPPPERSDVEQRILRDAVAIGVEDAIVILDSAKHLGAEKAKLRLLKAVEDTPSSSYSAMNVRDRSSLYASAKDEARPK